MGTSSNLKKKKNVLVIVMVNIVLGNKQSKVLVMNIRDVHITFNFLVSFLVREYADASMKHPFSKK